MTGGYTIRKSFDKLLSNNKVYMCAIIGHGMTIGLTAIVLKIIYLLNDLLFPEPPTIIEYMETLSWFGIVIMFLILVIFDICDIYSSRRK